MVCVTVSAVVASGDLNAGASVRPGMPPGYLVGWFGEEECVGNSEVVVRTEF